MSKTKNKENKGIKMLIIGIAVGIIITLIISLIIMGVIENNENKKKKDKYDKYLNAKVENCSSKTLKEVIDEANKKTGVKVKVTDIDLKTGYAHLKYKKEKENITITLKLDDTVSIIDSSKDISTAKKELCGVQTRVQNNTVANSEYDVSLFNELTTDELVSKISDGKKYFVYIGRSTCVYCIKYIPNLKQAQNEYNYTTMYIDLLKMSSDDMDKIKAYGGVAERVGTTPMLLIFENGKLSEGSLGYTEYDILSAFLERNGYTK